MKKTYQIDKELIRSAYKKLLLNTSHFTRPKERHLLKKAFLAAAECFALQNTQLSYEQFISNVEVACIVSSEINLDLTSVVASLLQETISHGKNAVEGISEWFGNHVLNIVNGIHRISILRTEKINIQPENFIQLLLKLTDDIRIILIRLADRLYQMRHATLLNSETLKLISAETASLYAPLAHKLGLYKIKAELDELSMQLSYPEIYRGIRNKIEASQEEQERFFKAFIQPLKNEIHKLGIPFEIKFRTKSIPSIWNKMKSQNIDFEQVYDFFAIRIIIDTVPENEKADCWRVYSIITNIYQPDPTRLRDWVTVPKSNGYESLHTTVVTPEGRWVEVQIRSRRMDANAETGLAAHWRYKGLRSDEQETEHILRKIRTHLENFTPGDEDQIKPSRLELFSDYVYVYTPQGDLKKLKAGATVLDFAFDIHTEVGQHCSGAKVNNLYVPLKQKLNTGDQVEIITSKNQKPTRDWLTFVTTSKAVSKIKRYLKEQEFAQAETGKDMLLRKLSQLRFNPDDEIVNKLIDHFETKNALELYDGIASGRFDITRLKKEFLNNLIRSGEPRSLVTPEVKIPSATNIRSKSKYLVIINNDTPLNNVILAKCCNPVPGDSIFGFVTVAEGIKIHRQQCTNAHEMMTRYPYRIVSAQWADNAETSSYNAELAISGKDQVGMLNQITQVITYDAKANIRSININSVRNRFEGLVIVNVSGKPHLDMLISKLLKIKGIEKVIRKV